MTIMGNSRIVLFEDYRICVENLSCGNFNPNESADNIPFIYGAKTMIENIVNILDTLATEYIQLAFITSFRPFSMA